MKCICKYQNRIPLFKNGILNDFPPFQVLVQYFFFYFGIVSNGCKVSGYLDKKDSNLKDTFNVIVSSKEIAKACFNSVKLLIARIHFRIYF